MTIKLGVLMDPIQSIHIEKDSTFAMLLEAQRRNYSIYYFEQNDIFLKKNQVYANTKILSVEDNAAHWFDFHKEQVLPLQELQVLLMRKDPPFTLEYLYLTHLLEHAQAKGLLIVNDPKSLRDANEKLFASWFPECCPETLITSNKHHLHEFLSAHQDIVCKPLESMGGAGIFRVTVGDLNVNVIFETLTHDQTRHIIAQRFVPEVTEGDKRILMIDGNPVPYALARIPKMGEFRGNLAVGGIGKGVELTKNDRIICDRVGPVLRKKGLMFVGLDVIGDYLTEINVTSPTCIRQLDKIYSLNISAQLFDAIEHKLM